MSSVFFSYGRHYVPSVLDSFRSPGISLQALKTKSLDQGAKGLKVYQVDHLRNYKYVTPACARVCVDVCVGVRSFVCAVNKTSLIRGLGVLFCCTKWVLSVPCILQLLDKYMWTQQDRQQSYFHESEL